MGLRVGDKVKVIDMLRISESFEIGETGKIVGIYEYCNNYPISVRMDKDKEIIDFSKEELELYKEDKMEKTFREVITDIKEGEVWINSNRKIELVNGDVQISRVNGKEFKSNILQFSKNINYKLKRKEYTFQEAFAAYEEGKETQSAVTGIKYQKRRLPYENQRTDCFNSNGDWRKVEDVYRLFSLQEIRGSWYINE